MTRVTNEGQNDSIFCVFPKKRFFCKLCESCKGNILNLFKNYSIVSSFRNMCVVFRKYVCCFPEICVLFSRKYVCCFPEKFKNSLPLETNQQILYSSVTWSRNTASSCGEFSTNDKIPQGFGLQFRPPWRFFLQ